MKEHTNTRLSLYWKCQLIGWSVASFYWGYAASLAGNFNFPQGIADYVLDIITGILLTHAYRTIVLRKKYNALPLKKLVPVMIPAVLVLSLLYMLLVVTKLYFVHLFFDPAWAEGFTAFFKSSALTVFITGTRLLSIWALAYHLYHYAQREITITKENARLALITKDAQLSNLSAQLNPHFFFNSLNNIKALIIENPAAARRAVDLLAELLRTSLYRKDATLIALKEELALVNDYLELEKLRLEERLQTCIEVDEQLENSLVPRLCIQTLVENAIKHGIDKKKEGGTVAVKITKQQDVITITVRNPGRLDEAKSAGGLGLKNLQERIYLHFKEKGQFYIAEQPDETVLATLLIPSA